MDVNTVYGPDVFASSVSVLFFAFSMLFVTRHVDRPSLWTTVPVNTAELATVLLGNFRGPKNAVK